MPRIICVWAPYWPLDHRRLSKAPYTARSPTSLPAPQTACPTSAAAPEPFVLVHTQANARRLAALNRAAEACGLFRGQALADAQAIVPSVQFADADPRADEQALNRLGLWALRFSPSVHASLQSDGSGLLLIDIQGCAHLFGGERSMALTLQARLDAWGVSTQLGLADTIGAAYALARFSGVRLSVAPAGVLRAVLQTLPVAALRVEDILAALHRAGLKTIQDVMGIGRQALTARFGAGLLTRLDQALGLLPEPLNPLIPPLAHRAHILVSEPVMHLGAVIHLISQAAHALSGHLVDKGLGARRLRLSLHRTDGQVVRIEVGCAAPSHDAAHLTRLFQERFKGPQGEPDLGLGIEGVTLEAQAEAAAIQQSRLDTHPTEEPGALNLLIDRLGSRLTLARVQRIDAAASHIPERAMVARMAAAGPAKGWDDASALSEWPLLMLPAAEPAEVIAEIPDGPPKRFRWRRMLYEVARAEGPQRVAPEWWRPDADGLGTRDYYRVEDTEGRRFWLLREGLYGDGAAAPRWFVQGVFA